MLKLSLKNPTTQATETFDVVTEFNQFFDRAKEYGLIDSIFSLKVKEMSAEDAPLRLHADSDVSNGLLRILSDSDNLYYVKNIDESVSSAREELHDDLEANLVNEQYDTTEELYADIKEMMKSLAGTQMSFFCPLRGNLSDHDGDYYETDAYMINDNADAVEEAIAKEQATEINMAEYVGDHASIKDIPSKAAGTLFGMFLKSGKKDFILRKEIIGAIKLELLPEWARQRFLEITMQDNGIS